MCIGKLHTIKRGNENRVPCKHLVVIVAQSETGIPCGLYRSELETGHEIALGKHRL